VHVTSERSIGVVGAGNMGSGIAQKIATEGFPVVLVDVDEAAAQRGVARIRVLLDEAIERKLFDAGRAAAILQRIRPAGTVAACADCDLVIEAVFEDVDVKRDLFRRLDAACAPHTRLATNTSSFYVRDLAAATRRPDRVVGLHFFYHPAKNRLVEVVPGRDTSSETQRWAWSFAEATGKTPIASADAPGFVVNRYFVPWLNEAVRILDEGVADIPTIEAASRAAFGIGMGPFELMNVTGVPIALHAATTLGRELGAFYAPAPLLARQVEAGAPWPLTGAAGSDPEQHALVAGRLQAVVFFVATQLVEQGVCSAEDADIGARVGLRWTRGPFELANRVGVPAAEKQVAALVKRWPGVQVPQLLQRQAAGGTPFRFEYVRLMVADGLAEITLNRPDAMNALNEEVVAQLARVFDAAESHPDVRTIVLRGAGKAFVAGADVKFFVKRMEEGDLDRIQRFTAAGQELLRRIDTSHKHVVVRLDGLSLGGGSELALCGDTIVATEKASFGFPETGIGIYPGLGGTQRTTRRCGAALARWLILTGETVDAPTAHRIGLVDEVVRGDRVGERILAIHASAARPPAAGEAPRAHRDLDPRLKALEEFFANADIEALLAGTAATSDPAVAKTAGRVRHKAPVACRIADRLIRDGAERGLDAGLAMELAHLQEIFSTADAHEGLTALLAGRRPQFQGK
jgi:enoyl-CoA hydratase/3-hydroxyacyl-CoA dehydrogenase